MTNCWRSIAFVMAAVAVLAGCHRQPVTVKSQRLAPLARGEVRYIAVLPFASGPEVDAVPPEPGLEVQAEPAAMTVQRAFEDAMRSFPAWELTDDIVVGEALRKVLGEVRPVSATEAAEIGRLLGVDGMVRGIVRRFEGRVGTQYAARRPALVDFAVELVVFPAAEVVWQAEYVERQQPLSDDLWNLFGFVRTRGRWLRVGELTALGARQVAAEMHHTLYRGEATPIPTP